MFTWLAYVLAFLISILGILRIATAVVVVDAPEAALRYLGTTDTGSAMDTSIYYVLCGVALGVAAEMSRSLKKIASVEYE